MNRILRNFLVGGVAYMAIAFSMQTGRRVTSKVYEPNRVDFSEAEYINHIDDLNAVHAKFNIKQDLNQGLIFAKLVWR